MVLPTWLEPADSAPSCFMEEDTEALAEDGGRPLRARHFTPSTLLLRTVWALRGSLLFSGALRIVNTFIQIFPSFILRALLQSLERPPGGNISGGAGNKALMAANFFSRRSGVQLALMLFCTLCLKVLVENAFFTSVVDMSTKARHMLNSLVFHHTIESPTFGTSSNITELSLVSSDIPTVESFVSQLHTIWDAPLQVYLYSKILKATIGDCALKGMLVLVVSVPLSTALVSASSRIRRLGLKWRDQR